MPKLISNETLFTTKLEQILDNDQTKNILCWGQNRYSVQIYDKKKLLQQILPKHFRHNRFQSFVRQMNLYGFRKIRTEGKHTFINHELKNGKKMCDLKSKNQIKKENDQADLLQSVQNQDEININIEMHENSQIQKNQEFNLYLKHSTNEWQQKLRNYYLVSGYMEKVRQNYFYYQLPVNNQISFFNQNDIQNFVYPYTFGQMN